MKKKVKEKIPASSQLGAASLCPWADKPVCSFHPGTALLGSKLSRVSYACDGALAPSSPLSSSSELSAFPKSGHGVLNALSPSAPLSPPSCFRSCIPLSPPLELWQITLPAAVSRPTAHLLAGTEQPRSPTSFVQGAGGLQPQEEEFAFIPLASSFGILFWHRGGSCMRKKELIVTYKECLKTHNNNQGRKTDKDSDEAVHYRNANSQSMNAQPLLRQCWRRKQKERREAISLPSDWKTILNIDDLQCQQGGGQSNRFDTAGGTVSCHNLWGQ